MNNIAIITARSGSKGLIDKNIKPLCGKPLMVYTIEAAISSNCFDTVMVSTDSDQYANIAREYGAEVPFLRSMKNSSDKAGSWEVVDEVLERYRENGCEFNTICLLQPTSPLRMSEDIIGGHDELVNKEADAITGVCIAEHAPSVYLTLPQDRSMEEYREKNGFYLPRQNQAKLYRINGALYIRRIIYHSNRIETLYKKEYAYVMDTGRSIDIDTELDFAIAEALIQRIEQIQ